MKQVVLSRSDGGVSVLILPSLDQVHSEIAKWETTGGGVVIVEWRDMTDAPFPERAFRNAWMYRGTTITVDMAKARMMHMTRIRAVRNSELDRLDKDWMRAVGQGNTVIAATIEAQRQALRDLPQTFDLNTALTPEELKARWPSQLPRP